MLIINITTMWEQPMIYSMTQVVAGFEAIGSNITPMSAGIDLGQNSLRIQAGFDFIRSNDFTVWLQYINSIEEKYRSNDVKIKLSAAF